MPCGADNSVVAGQSSIGDGYGSRIRDWVLGRRGLGNVPVARFLVTRED